VHVDLDVLAAPEIESKTEPQPLGTRRCHLHDGPGIMPAVARALACDAGVVLAVHDPARAGRLLDVGRRRRRPTAAILRALWIRDRACVHPGCHRRQRLHAHHVVHWARGGRTALSNLVLLCSRHHHALHRGEFDVSIDPAGTPRLQSPTGPLPAAPPALPGPGPLGDTHDARVTADTLSSGSWRGEPLDLPYAVTALHDSWNRAASLVPAPRESPAEDCDDASTEGSRVSGTRVSGSEASGRDVSGAGRPAT
jgi:hypothetical protein